jgi:hypothetical protein
MTISFIDMPIKAASDEHLKQALGAVLQAIDGMAVSQAQRVLEAASQHVAGLSVFDFCEAQRLDSSRRAQSRGD